MIGIHRPAIVENRSPLGLPEVTPHKTSGTGSHYLDRTLLDSPVPPLSGQSARKATFITQLESLMAVVTRLFFRNPGN